MVKLAEAEFVIEIENDEKLIPRPAVRCGHVVTTTPNRIREASLKCFIASQLNSLINKLSSLCSCQAYFQMLRKKLNTFQGVYKKIFVSDACDGF